MPPAQTARTFRITTPPDQAPLVDALLAAQGFASEPEPFFPLARRLTAEPFPLGASLAASFGLIYIQDRSSMLPPVLLAPPAGARCLDMCSSPGGKTGILAQLAGRTGFVLAVEPSRERLATLRQNLRRMNAVNAATAGAEAQHLPLPPGGFDHILLDPPCSGWGTVDKNPKVLELWTPDKAETLVRLQRELLAKAAELLRPGGSLLFSTCTTNVRENEDQAAWALDHLPLGLAALPAPAGFQAVDPARAGVEGVLRVGVQGGGDGHGGGGAQGQGFFLARFVKLGPGAGPGGQGPNAESSAEPHIGPHVEPHAQLAGRALTEAELLEAGPLLLSALPPGQVQDFGGKAYFLHRHALDLGLGSPRREQGREQGVEHGAGGGLRWQGFPVGQTTGTKDLAGRDLPGRDQSGRRGQAGGKGAGKGAGKSGGAATHFKLDPRLRALLPPAETLAPAQKLDAEDTAPLLDLLAGRSLEAPAVGKGEGGLLGLYFRGLPLGWLTRKGRRLLWSDR